MRLLEKFVHAVEQRASLDSVKCLSLRRSNILVSLTFRHIAAHTKTVHVLRKPFNRNPKQNILHYFPINFTIKFRKRVKTIRHDTATRFR